MLSTKDVQDMINALGVLYSQETSESKKKAMQAELDTLKILFFTVLEAEQVVVIKAIRDRETAVRAIIARLKYDSSLAGVLKLETALPAASGGGAGPEEAGPPGAGGGADAVAAITTGPGASPAASGSVVAIDVTNSDLDAIARTVQSEVGHFGKHGADQLKGAVAAVVDTIFNRVAHAGHPSSVSDVIDYKHAFSKITQDGGWRNAPKATGAIVSTVKEHVAGRAEGEASAIKGATHFLNPHFSSASAMASWGRYVVENAVAEFGDDSARDVHFHGFPPNGRLPGPYVIGFEGRRAAFSGTGLPAVAGAPQAGIAGRIIGLCYEENKYFENGVKKEYDDPQYKRVGLYWSKLNLPFDGRTKIEKSNGETFNPAWSAAFISYVLRQAGAGDDFPIRSGALEVFPALRRFPGRPLVQGAPGVRGGSGAGRHRTLRPRVGQEL